MFQPVSPKVFGPELYGMDNLDSIVDAEQAFRRHFRPDALEQAKARFLGKSGRITELLKGLGKLPPEEKTAGAAINRAKEAVEAASTPAAKPSAKLPWRRAWPRKRSM